MKVRALLLVCGFALVGCNLDWSGSPSESHDAASGDGDGDAGGSDAGCETGAGCVPEPTGDCADPLTNTCDTEPFACVSRGEAGGHDCVCPAGYAGVGVGPDGCVDVDECASGEHTCDSDPQTTCTNTVGSFECGACPDGFAGHAKDGESGCVPVLAMLATSRGVLQPAFEPEITEYVVDLRPWEDLVDVTPTASPGIALQFDGAPASSAEAATVVVDRSDKEVEVVLDAGGARRTYTLTMRLSLPEPTYSKAAYRQADDGMAFVLSMSADGNVIAVGAPGEDSDVTGVGQGGQLNDNAAGAGAVMLFERGVAGFEQTTFFKSPRTRAADDYGRCVALSADGSTLVIGAPGEGSSSSGVDSTPNDDAPKAGAAFVYRRRDDGWALEGYLKPKNPRAQDGFGAYVTVSADGSTIAAGARLEDSASTGINGTFDVSTPLASSGAAYVFVRDAAGRWSEQAYVKADVTGASDRFGVRVELSGDGNLLAVGAEQEDSATRGVRATPSTDDGALNSGAVYVYRRSGTSWALEAYLKASDSEAGDTFGEHIALSLDGRTLAVASKREGTGDQQFYGKVYVFVPSGTSWSQQAIITASNREPGDYFGEDVGLNADGSVLVVGATAEDSAADDPARNPVQDSGAAYVFARRGVSWQQKALVKSPFVAPNDYFGDMVKLSADGRTLAVGTAWEDSSTASGQHPNMSAPDSGAFYVY